jgi:glycosyltransferase involved in cell wall biosynthesis
VLNIAIFCDTPLNRSNGIKIHADNLKKLLNSSQLFRVTLYFEFKKAKIKLFKKNIYKKELIENIITSNHIDYINVHGFITMLPIIVISIARKKNIPVIYEPHMHPFHTLNRPFLGKIFFIILLKPLLKYCDKIVTINREEYDFFKKYNKNCHLISHWIHKTYLPRDIHIHKQNSLLFVGRNDSNKNLQFLYNLPKDMYTVTCVTNKKPMRNDFIFYNNIDDMGLDLLYDSSSLVIVPSRYEAFSLVALESLSHGTPILISDRVRISDYLSNISGCTVFKYNDIQDFLDKLPIALKTSVDISKIAHVFSMETALTNYRQVYN